MIFEVLVGGKAGHKPHRLELERGDAGWKCRLDGRSVNVDALIPRSNVLSLLVDGRSYEIKREQTATDLHLWVGSSRFAVELRDPVKILAPMPGRVVRVLVEENGEVEAGQGVVVVEAMKMQNEIKSPKKGTVKEILAVAGAAVNPGDTLAIVE